MNLRPFARGSLPLAALLCTLSDGAAAPLGPGVPVRIVVPPSEVVEGVRKVSVGTFSGFEGDRVAGLVATAMADPNRERAGGLGEVGAELLDSAVEVGAQAAANAVGGGLQGKLVSGLTKAAAGKVTDELTAERLVLDDGLRPNAWEVVTRGADATVRGSVEVDEKVEDSKAKVARKDDKGNTVKDSKGNVVYDEIPCKKRTVTASVRWELAKGQAVALSQTSSRKAADSQCGDEIKKLAGKDALASAALGGVGLEVANALLPAWVSMRIPLRQEKALKNELRLAKEGQHMLAICGLRNVVQYDPDLVDAAFNYAALHEALGHHDVAAEYYQKAMTADPGLAPAAKGYTRVTDRKKAVERMRAAYGLPWKVGEPDYSSCPPVPEGRRMVVKKDTELLDADGNAIGELSKNQYVYVTDDSGATYSVTTSDGQVGWVDPKKLR